MRIQKRVLPARGMAILFFLLFYAFGGFAQDRYQTKGDSSTLVTRSAVVIPFAFYLKPLGVAAATTLATQGWIQPQTNSTLLGIISSNGARYINLDVDNVQLPGIERLFVHPQLNVGHYASFDVYGLPNPLAAGPLSGTHNSHDDNYITFEDDRFRVDLRVKYLLPMGFGKETIINRQQLDEGFVSRGKSTLGGWFPWTNGRTTLELGIFYSNDKLSSDLIDQKLKTGGYSMGFTTENVDFKPNPMQGSIVHYTFKQVPDFSWNTQPWTMSEGDISLFFSLPTQTLRQQTVALHLWTAHVHSWNDYTATAMGKVYHRPSPFTRPGLGGVNRFRGYPEMRYNNQSAWMYAAEYRITPSWNPLGKWRLLANNGIRVSWMQFVPFFEAGRVAPEYNLKRFHTQMHFDVGLGWRLFVNNLVVRVDVAKGEENMQVQMFVQQAF